jgi:hypothetical protein
LGIISENSGEFVLLPTAFDDAAFATEQALAMHVVVFEVALEDLTVCED